MFDPSTDPFVAPPCLDAITTLFEDDDILVVNKPSGLLSLSGKNPLNKDSVHHRLSQTHASIRLLHRLDFGTSGVLLLAKHKAANTRLMQQFHARLIEKSYLAVLDGLIETPNFRIEAAIAKGDFPKQRICSLTGKPAISEGKVLSTDSTQQSSRVALTPLTGRTHQLRLHCLAFGHPILGCDLYHQNGSDAKATRLLLHAHQLGFQHPSTGEPMNIVADCPF